MADIIGAATSDGTDEAGLANAFGSTDKVHRVMLTFFQLE